jgi:iron(III) transport system permease protein
LIVALAVVIGYARARARFSGRGLIGFLFIITFAVPSTVVGVGLISLWNRPGLPGKIYYSSAIMLIAYMARFVPVAGLMLAASSQQVPNSFEEAAEVAGAGWVRIFTRIVLPQIHTGIAAAWAVSFILAFGELGTTVLVAPPGDTTLSLRIYTLIANAPSNQVAALALMQAGIILLPLAGLGIFLRERGQK